MRKLKICLLLGALLSFLGCLSNNEKTTEIVVENLNSKRNPRIGVLVSAGFHGEETYIPMGYMTNKGMEVTVIGPEVGRVESWDKKYNIIIEKSINDVLIDDFDALIIPGGSAPARMSEVPEVVQFTVDFFNSSKIIASICHGPQLLAATGMLKGKTITGVPDIQEEIEASGAVYVNEAVVIYENLITSRDPDDIPSFVEAIENVLKQE